MRHPTAPSLVSPFLTLALLAAWSPPPLAGQFILTESCAWYVERDYFQVDVQGYSRTYIVDWPYFAASPSVISALYQAPGGGWIDYAWRLGVWGAEAIVDVQGSLLPRGYTYQVQGMHWFFYDTDFYVGTTNASVYVPVVPIVPWGESSYFVGMWQSSPVFQAAFNAVLWPEGYVFNGGRVYESVPGFYDECRANDPAGSGPQLTLEADGSWTVGELGDGVYGHHWVGVDRNWVDYYTQLIASQQMAPCSVGAVQTMFYQSGWGVGTAYQVNATGVFLDGYNLTAVRGNASASSPAP